MEFKGCLVGRSGPGRLVPVGRSVCLPVWLVAWPSVCLLVCLLVSLCFRPRSLLCLLLCVSRRFVLIDVLRSGTLRVVPFGCVWFRVIVLVACWMACAFGSLQHEQST